MGKVESYEIELDNHLATYFPGQTVSGKVIFHLKQEIDLKGIFIKVKGEAYVSWGDWETHYNQTTKREERKMYYRRDRQIYFNIKRDIFGEENAGKLGPGQFQYPFSVNLPASLPSSFEGENGYIRYTCSSYVSRPHKNNPKSQTCFTVLECADLNMVPGVTVPGNSENVQKTGCYCYNTGSISASVTINKKGFVPGENVFISANINNNSKAELKRTTASLICYAAYKAMNHHKREAKTICSIDGPSIPPHSDDHWTDKFLKIPPIPPSRYGSLCKIISLTYVLQFTVDPSGLFNTDLNITIPVTIGSIPLRTDFPTFAPILSHVGLAANDNGSSTLRSNMQPYLTSSEMNKYPDLPPPTYEECVLGNANLLEVDDDQTHSDLGLQFSPRYTYYNQTQSTDFY